MNNLFHSLNAFGVGMMDGASDDLYVRVERALIAFNTFAGCSPGDGCGAKSQQVSQWYGA